MYMLYYLNAKLLQPVKMCLSAESGSVLTNGGMNSIRICVFVGHMVTFGDLSS